MSDTRRLRVLKAVAAALAGVGAPTGLNVHRNTYLATEKDKLPSMVVHDGDPVSHDDRGGTLVEDVRRVVVEIRVLGNHADAPDDVIDPFYSWAVQALMADYTLGGEATLTTVRAPMGTEAVEADRVYVRMLLPVDVQFHYRRDNPELDS